MTLYVERHGHGPDLVLLHGWGLHGGVWRPLIERLAGRWRINAVDLPGHGRSPAAAGGFDLAGAAQAVAAAVPAGAVWLGWSLGGMVALAAAAAGVPMRVVAVTGSAARFSAAPDWPHAVAPALLAAFAADLTGDYRATLQRFLALQARGSERAREEIRALREGLFAHGEPDPAALAGGLAALRDQDLRPLLPRVAPPALLLHGERDTLVPLAAARATAGLLPAATLYTISGAGHAPFLSHPDAFAKALEEHLRD